MPNQRRTFIKNTALGATGLMLLPPYNPAMVDQKNITEILKKTIGFIEERIPGLLAGQINAPGDRWHGGLANGYEIPNAHSTTALIVNLANVYCCPFSKYYQDVNLEGPLKLAAACLVNIQYEDGTIDLYSTNFHSTPDTAFIVNDLAPIYELLLASENPAIAEVIQSLKAFLLKAGECLTIGGIHTANHRWVVSGALACLHHLFPNAKYVSRIEEWLSEGIDQDPDGQYTERSVSIYSPICNNMFLTIGRLLNRPKLFDVVRKNLEMTLYYIQPGGEVLTDASGRQDSTRIGLVHGYYYSYKYFAILDQNPVFEAVCHLIETTMPNRITRYFSMLFIDPHFNEASPEPSLIPIQYRKHFKYSGVYRIRENNLDVSVIENNPTFLVVKKGDAVLQSMRLHAAFFGSKGQFAAEEMEVVGTEVRLKRSIAHGYFQPFPAEKRTGDGNWEEMPRSKRALTERQILNYLVTIKVINQEVLIEVSVEGTDEVPVCIELSFRTGGKLDGVESSDSNGLVHFLEQQQGQYKMEDDVISFSPGVSGHKWAPMRGMWEVPSGENVYLTGSTPFHWQGKLF